MRGRIVNGMLFQLVWIGCVWGGATGRWWLGPLFVVAFGLWQVPRTDSPLADLKLATVAAGTGLIVDTAYLRLGLVAYPEPGPWVAMAPIWILALWVGFALTLNHSLAWLKGRPALAAVMGATAGPLSFWVGANTWKASEFLMPAPVVLAVLAFAWALIIPGLVTLAFRADRRAKSLRGCELNAAT